MSNPCYKLIYHAGIPGRGEFARLYFEATGTPYTDAAQEEGQKCIGPYLKDGFPGCDDNPTPFAPPILVHGNNVISQTSNILLYLSGRLPPLDFEAEKEDGEEPANKKSKRSGLTLDDPELFHVNELSLTILDCLNEAHDTHHPLKMGDYYEAQKEAALIRSKDYRETRIPKYFNFFEGNIKKANSGYLLKEASYADLVFFQVVNGLLFAFPNLFSKQRSKYPLSFKLYEKIKSSPRIASYLKSERRQEYSMGIFRHYEELDDPTSE